MEIFRKLKNWWSGDVKPVATPVSMANLPIELQKVVQELMVEERIAIAIDSDGHAEYVEVPYWNGLSNEAKAALIMLGYHPKT